jgi:hypothetical protein
MCAFDEAMDMWAFLQPHIGGLPVPQPNLLVVVKNNTDVQDGWDIGFADKDAFNSCGAFVSFRVVETQKQLLEELSYWSIVLPKMEHYYQD